MRGENQSVTSQNNINMNRDDPIRTAKLSAALDNRLANFRRHRRLERIRKIRGLSARQLMERKISQRATKEPKLEPIARDQLNREPVSQATGRDASLSVQ